MVWLFTGVMGIWVIVAWLACAIFSGYVASEKNRCGFCWFVWGALFGPIALITTVGLPELAEADKKRRKEIERPEWIDSVPLVDDPDQAYYPKYIGKDKGVK